MKIHRILFFVFHLLTTVPWLRPDSETPALYFARPERFLDNIRNGDFCRDPTWALCATGSQKWPTNVEPRDCVNGNTLRATALHLDVRPGEQGEIVQGQVICLHICAKHTHPPHFVNFDIQVQSVSSPDSWEGWECFPLPPSPQHHHNRGLHSWRAQPPPLRER